MKKGLLVVVALLIIAAVAIGGYVMYNTTTDEESEKTTVNTNSTVTNESKTNTVVANDNANTNTATADDRYTNSKLGFSVKLPETWVAYEGDDYCGKDLKKNNAIGFISKDVYKKIQADNENYAAGKSKQAPCYEGVNPITITVRQYNSVNELENNTKKLSLTEYIAQQKKAAETSLTPMVQKIQGENVDSYRIQSAYDGISEEHVFVTSGAKVYNITTIYTDAVAGKTTDTATQKQIVESFKNL